MSTKLMRIKESLRLRLDGQRWLCYRSAGSEGMGLGRVPEM